MGGGHRRAYQFCLSSGQTTGPLFINRCVTGDSGFGKPEKLGKL
jgi:hypothetical protein